MEATETPETTEPEGSETKETTKPQPPGDGLFYYLATSTSGDSELEENYFPHARILLDEEGLVDLFEKRIQLLTVRDAPGPTPCEMTYYSAAEFGYVNETGASRHDLAGRLDNGSLVWGWEVGYYDPDDEEQTTVTEVFDPEVDEEVPYFQPSEYRYTAYDEVNEYAVEITCVPKYGGELNAYLPWRVLENLVADRPAWFPVSQSAREMAVSVLVDNAPDRIAILADALDEGGAPSWLTYVIRLSLKEDRYGAKGGMLPTVLFREAGELTAGPLFRTIAGYLPWDPPEEERP